MICHTCQQKGHYARECSHGNLYAENESESSKDYDQHIEMEKPADAQSLINDEFPDDGTPLTYLEHHLLITKDQHEEQDYNHAPIFRS